MLSDLNAQVGNQVTVYVTGSNALMGTLVSVDSSSGGVTKLTTDDGTTTTHMEVLSASICGFNYQTAD